MTKRTATRLRPISWNTATTFVPSRNS